MPPTPAPYPDLLCGQPMPDGSCLPPGNAAGAPPGGGLAEVADAFREALDTSLSWVLPLWTGREGVADFADLRSLAAPTGPVVRWVGGAVLAAVLVIGGLRIAYSRRGGHAADLLESVLRHAAASVLGWALVGSAWRASGAICRWLVDPVSADEDGYREAVIRALDATSPTLTVLLGSLGVAACIGLFLALLADAVCLLLATLTLPVVAAAGRARARWLAATIAALLCFRPVSAICYRIGYGLVVGSGHPEEKLQTAALGVLMIVITAAMLPVLVRVARSSERVPTRHTPAPALSAGGPAPVSAAWQAEQVSRSLPPVLAPRQGP